MLQILVTVRLPVTPESLSLRDEGDHFSRDSNDTFYPNPKERRENLGSYLSAERNSLLRAFVLLWGRLGPARFYIAAIAIVVVGLAGVGLWHLILPRKQTASSPTVSISKKASPPASPAATAVARISPSAELSSPSSIAPSPPSVTPELERQVAITDVTQREERGRHGETFVVATIGLASRTDVEKNGVEIHVYFYDLAATNEMRPTDAQVTYQWLTPVRDWSDPAPKYLAATYFKPPTRYHSFERLRYGGFVVRVFSDGKLQDERSQPEGLIALFHNNATDQSPSPTTVPVSSPPPAVAVTSPQPKNATSTNPTPQLTPSPLSSRSPALRDEDRSSGSLPYGKPIPGKPGFLNSPYDPKFIIDVRGFPPGTLVIDPNTNKPFRVP